MDGQKQTDLPHPAAPLSTPKPPKQHWWLRLRHWIITHKKASVAIGVGIVVVLAGAGVGLYFLFKPEPTKPVTATPEPAKAAPAPEKPKYYSPLTGLEVPDEAATKAEVTGIMIENSQWARPQSGLDDAGVVFEAIAEGGITRFAALYQQAKPDLIGPVRSLRPYFLDWMAAFDASIVHIGGSANALNEVRNGQYKDADQFFNGQYFWRATDRYAPHNVYTSFAKLDELNQAKGYTSSEFTGFPRKNDEPSTTPDATSIDIDISYNLFNVHYDYNKGCNCYLRKMAGEPHIDRESGSQIEAKTVIVMKIPTTIGFEDGYREQMTTIGSGTVYVFQDGKVAVGTWDKKGRKDQITFTNESGDVIKLDRGKTWITAVDTNPQIERVQWQ